MSKPQIAARAFTAAWKTYQGSADSREVRSVLLSIFLKAKFRQEYSDVEDLLEDLEHRGYRLQKESPGYVFLTHKYGGYEVFPVATAWKSIAAILTGQRDLKDPRENEQYSEDDIPFY